MCNKASIIRRQIGYSGQSLKLKSNLAFLTKLLCPFLHSPQLIMFLAILLHVQIFLFLLESLVIRPGFDNTVPYYWTSLSFAVFFCVRFYFYVASFVNRVAKTRGEFQKRLVNFQWRLFFLSSFKLIYYYWAEPGLIQD